MKQIFYNNQKATVQIGKDFIEVGVNEISLEIYPTKQDISVEPIINLEEIRSVEFINKKSDYVSFKFPLNDEARKFFKEWIEPRPFFRQFTVEAPGFINGHAKKIWREIQGKGYIFDLRFRQIIVPRLAYQASFLTALELGENRGFASKVEFSTDF